ncbi:hypothetical protein [uncultured Megasphaera sp.]|uniref:hypothetical protein n=1 Tax=uncultured Megasphaera sp. TaxID=165188 RepID=UPI002604C01D|nr:hypothetical protein [uncultured Megasphaera sp.]
MTLATVTTEIKAYYNQKDSMDAITAICKGQALYEALTALYEKANDEYIAAIDLTGVDDDEKRDTAETLFFLKEEMAKGLHALIAIEEGEDDDVAAAWGFLSEIPNGLDDLVKGVAA